MVRNIQLYPIRKIVHNPFHQASTSNTHQTASALFNFAAEQPIWMLSLYVTRSRCIFSRKATQIVPISTRPPFLIVHNQRAHFSYFQPAPKQTLNGALLPRNIGGLPTTRGSKVFSQENGIDDATIKLRRDNSTHSEFSSSRQGICSK